VNCPRCHEYVSKYTLQYDVTILPEDQGLSERCYGFALSRYAYFPCVHCGMRYPRHKKCTLPVYVYGYCTLCEQQYGEHIIAVHKQVVRARRMGRPATLSVKAWMATMAYFQGKCAYCQIHPYEVIEHFVPLKLGGGTTAYNCVPK